jgi:hypothetical protein
VLLSLRRRGQLLLLTCTLMGVFVGASLGMVADRPGTPSALMAPAPARQASAVAANPASGQPARPQATAPRSRTGGEAVVARNRPAHRAHRHHQNKRDHKDGHGEGKHHKDK